MILGRFSNPEFGGILTIYSLWGIYLVTDKLTRIDDLVHFTLREWSRLSYNVTEAEVERAKAQLKASILLSLDGTTSSAEDIGRQIITTGRRMGPEEIERVISQISEKDVMSFAQRKLWDQDVAVSAVGSIEGLLDYNRQVVSCRNICSRLLTFYQNKERHEQKCLDVYLELYERGDQNESVFLY